MSYYTTPEKFVRSYLRHIRPQNIGHSTSAQPGSAVNTNLGIFGQYIVLNRNDLLEERVVALVHEILHEYLPLHVNKHLKRKKVHVHRALRQEIFIERTAQQLAKHKDISILAKNLIRKSYIHDEALEIMYRRMRVKYFPGTKV